MSKFLTELFGSIFTPGPSPSIIIATNVSFAALQIVFFGLLIATYSLHFVALSVLCAALWLSINWFVKELETASSRETEIKPKGALPNAEKDKDPEDRATEIGNSGTQSEQTDAQRTQTDLLGPVDADAVLRKRRSLGEASSGNLSTDSEWDKVSEADAVGT